MNTNLNIPIGKDEYNKDFVLDIAEVKHLLMTGSTGSGKSTLIHKIITTLISNNPPEDLKLILIDPKRVELTMYKNIPHALTLPIIDPKMAVLAMKWVVKEMDRRYMESVATPHMIVVIDEFSDLMQAYPKEAESLVVKIAGMGSPVGIHIILSTARPSVNIFTKAIQDVFSSRVGLQTSSSTDSKLIIGTDGACILRGAGDILFRTGMKYIVRAQVDNVTEKEIRALNEAMGEKYKDSTEFPIDIDESNVDELSGPDALYEEAERVAIESGKISTSYIQRKLGVGYSRAAQLMDMLEQKGVIGAAQGSKPREVIGK